MELPQIKEHWSNLAKKFKTDLRATTHTQTIKKLEVNALARGIKCCGLQADSSAELLEVGCGNGYNCLSLAEIFPNFRFTGLDFVMEMVENAKKLQGSAPELSDRLEFQQGDILHLSEHPGIKRTYDIVFTDRCIINLNTVELQLAAVDQLAARVRKGGHLLILENFNETYQSQNNCRQAVSLPRRTPASFNLFMDEKTLLEHTRTNLKLLHVDDFGSLHDLLLYVLVPMTNGGAIDYEHPLVRAAADLSVGVYDQYPNAFGKFGQNRLYVFNKIV
jgi:SAM-dependent methyltransferase